MKKCKAGSPGTAPLEASKNPRVVIRTGLHKSSGRLIRTMGRGQGILLN
jgi:hypothetical protein